MARSRRRVTRSVAQKSPERSPSSSRSSLTPMEDEPEPKPAEFAPTKADEDTCPSCREDVQGEKSNWIRCDACKTWFHWACVGNSSDLELINKWCVLDVNQSCIAHLILILMKTGTVSHA